MKHHRFLAALYDRMTASAEKAGLRKMRAGLLAEASGRTLELGAGTGLNLVHYSPKVTELVLAEPDRFMARRLRQRIASEPPSVESVDVIETRAEELAFNDQSFDTVVGTLVLCTVEQPDRVLNEVARVLKPGGRYLFLEHVRSESPRLARWQDRLERPWGWMGGGCHPNRATGETLRGSQLEVERLDTDRFPKAPPLVRPLIRGAAKRPA
jgi:ubiquinone/menaquinone biosynthesis C-methylase UbiE